MSWFVSCLDMASGSVSSAFNADVSASKLTKADEFYFALWFYTLHVFGVQNVLLNIYNALYFLVTRPWNAWASFPMLHSRNKSLRYFAAIFSCPVPSNS